MAIENNFVDSLTLSAGFQKLFGNSPTAIAISRLSDGIFVEANQSFIELYGYSHDEVIGHTSEEFNFWNDLEERTRIIKQLQIEGYVHNFPVEYRHKSGSIGRALASINTFEIDGSPHLIGFITKVNDLDETQLALFNKDTEYRSLFENMLNGYAYCRMLIEEGEPKDFVYLSVNKSFGTLTGLKDVVGKRVSELLPGVLESSSELIDTYAEVAMKGTTARVETYIPTLQRWLTISVYSPRLGYFVAVFDDVTALYQTKDAELLRSKEEFRLMFDHMQEGVAHCRMINEGGKPVDYEFLAVNPAFEQITGWKEVIGRRISSIIPNYAKINPELFQLFGAVSSDGLARNWQRHIQEIDRYLTYSIYSPKFGEFIVISTDITESKMAEVELHKSNYILSESQRIAHVGSWQWFLSTGKTIWTEETYRIYGVSPETFTPNVESLLNIIHPDDRMSMQTWITDCAAGNNPKALEFRIVWPDGSIRIISGYGELQYDADNKPSHLLGMVHDITDRKRAEDNLRKSQLQSKVFVRDAPISIAMFDKKMNYLSASARWVHEYGRGYTDLVGMNHYDVHPDLSDEWKNAHQRGMHGETIKSDGDRWIQADGTELWLSWAIVPWTDHEGDIGGIIISTEDITAQKRAESSLREQNEQFNIMGRMTRTGGWMFNPSTGKGKWTKECAKIHDLPEDSPIDVASGINFYCQEYRQIITDAVQDAIMKAKPFDLELEIMSATGRRKWVRTIGEALVENGKVVQVHGAMQDITERKLVDEQLRLWGDAFEKVHFGLAMADAVTNTFISVNPTFARERGYDCEELIGKSILTVFPTGNVSQVKSMISELDEGSHIVYESMHICKDGRKFPVLLDITTIKSAEGVPIRRIAYALDITDRKLAESELKIAATAFETQEGILISDANNVILRVNRSFTEITGYEADEVIGKNPKLLSSGRQDKDFYKSMWESINSNGFWRGEIWNRKKSGEIYPESLTVTAVKDNRGTVTNYVASISDITRRKNDEEQIENLAFYDPLTGLPNRRLLQDRLGQAVASSVRTGRTGAILFVDLDSFKTINDTLGHSLGDSLLQQVGSRIQSCLRDGDTVSRPGGDEFVVMLNDLSGQETEAAHQAESVGEKILAVLEQPYLINGHQCHVTSSIGISLFGGRQHSTVEVMKQADIAMYQAKKEGKNAVRFFDPRMQESINARAELEGELRTAIQKNQFQLFYHVQTDSSHKACGAEALIRWIHPERGLIPPAEFIPIAEETGMILPIGDWVLNEACGQVRKWEHDELARELVISVNVSARQFHQVDFVDRVKETIQRSGIDPRHLKLELTESMLVENIEGTIVKMQKLKDIGITLSLDDFGTGYSSLRYLQRLPIDQLKIDQSFVQDIYANESNQNIVLTIIRMALSLKLDLIAEGVETEQQLEFLELRGCQKYQGYLFGKPLPIEQFELSLKQY